MKIQSLRPYSGLTRAVSVFGVSCALVLGILGTVGAEAGYACGLDFGNQLLRRFNLLMPHQVDQVAGEPDSRSTDHWLSQWLKSALSGELTGFPVNLEEKAPGLPFLAASQGLWGDSRQGTIWLPAGAGVQGAESTVRAFVDRWYVLLFEIGNLTAADRFAALRNRAVLGRIAELEYASEAIAIEVDSARVGCALFRGVILPLIGEKNMPSECLWKAWESTFVRGARPEPRRIMEMFPGHFQYYRAGYRAIRRFK